MIKLLAPILTSSFILCSIFLSPSLFADTTHHRLIWDSDPTSKATIGFSPDGNSTSPYVQYGLSTDESTWQRANVSNTETFRGGLTSHFVRLSGLTANSAIYYRVCDDDGCGQRFWFKTAPSDNQPYVAIAGGDTRTGWTNRQKGNQLVAKLRPLFIMHGGDFTNANNVSEMNAFLADWALTYSDDTINNIAYKRIYPMIPTHGNHEDNNYRTLCEAFGVDFNTDGDCNPLDTYGAFNVSPLLRVYTLNSQFKNSGWSSYANTMNSWLADDLAARGGSASWRFAQYHKPIFPHYTGKSENQILFDWWASYFYDYAMNLVVESDTHITKLTKSIKPSGSNFVETSQGGTVYVGEGSWGAPARSANDPKAWTIDLASIQQFKVITVSEDAVEIRTAQFDESASFLSREQRSANPILLPANVNWWTANTVGETVSLVRNDDNRTMLQNNDTTGEEAISFSAIADSFIASNQANQNFNGSGEGLLADGSDSEYGVMDSLIKWELNDLPQCAEITSASVEILLTNPSGGSYQVYSGASGWSEGSVTWNTVNGAAQQAVLMASFSAASTGSKNIILSAAGLTEVNKWRTGDNFGVVISSNGSNDGIDFNSKETGQAPRLNVRYVLDEACIDPGSNPDPDPDQNSLQNGVAVNNLSAAKGEGLRYVLDVEKQGRALSFDITGNMGDADLYVKYGAEPTSTDYDCRPYQTGSNEKCTFEAAPQGRYNVLMLGYEAFSDLTLTAQYTEDAEGLNAVSQIDLRSNKGTWAHFPVEIPAGTGRLSVSISGGIGDADLYVQRGSRATLSAYQCRPWQNGNAESCVLPNPEAGLWFISIQAYDTYSDVELNASWQP